MNLKEMMSDDKIIGGYNDPPPNLKQISEKEFAQSDFFVYSPCKTEYRQAKDIIKNSGLTAIWLYWFGDGTGIGIRNDYWEAKVYYYSFYICKHKWENIVNRMCYQENKCIKCGYISAVDSSD